MYQLAPFFIKYSFPCNKKWALKSTVLYVVTDPPYASEIAIYGEHSALPRWRLEKKNIIITVKINIFTWNLRVHFVEKTFQSHLMGATLQASAPVVELQLAKVLAVSWVIHPQGAEPMAGHCWLGCREDSAPVCKTPSLNYNAAVSTPKVYFTSRVAGK